METYYYREYSPNLMRDMELKRYGHAGRPVLFIPCQNGHFYDFENFHMLDVWQEAIDQGQCMVFSVDTLDEETWSGQGDPAWRIERHEAWMRFLHEEIGPFIQGEACRLNGWEGHPGIIAFGCSLGATHAANLFFRFPETFDGLLALSGIYTSTYGFGSFANEATYLNSAVDYLAGMPADHPYIERYRNGRGIIVCGQGAWEVPETTYRVKELCEAKNMGVWVDLWGYDSAHDWDWWYRQVAYHIPHLLG
ncbi:MAG: esterase family protein [Clostridia bacterium]|nr:esterase family protein [Clostridia bacterium]